MTTTPNMAEHETALPTGLMLLTAAGASALAGLAWAAVMLALGRGATDAWTGPVGASAVVVGAAVALLAIRPWRPRTLAQWPIVWVGGSFLRLLVTLSGAYLLYSATPFRSRMLWFAVAVAYVATLVGETRVYSMSMRRFAPDPTARPAPSGGPDRGDGGAAGESTTE